MTQNTRKQGSAKSETINDVKIKINKIPHF